MTEKQINEKLERYLKELEKHLEKIPVTDRSDILLELSGHIQDSLGKGDRSLEEILKALGKPEQVANRYLIERGIKPLPAKRFGWVKWGCFGTLGFFLVGFIALALLIKSFFPILSVDEKSGYVNILGGMIEVDESKGTVKLGKGLLNINNAGIDIKMEDPKNKISFFKNTKKDTVRGNGIEKTISKKIHNYNKIVLSGSIDARVSKGNTTQLEVSGDENLINNIETDVKNETLYLSIKDISYTTRSRLSVTTSTPNLNEVQINGSGDIWVNDIDNNNFSTQINGSGDIFITGSTYEFDAVVNGSGDIHAFPLITQEAKIHVRGSGDVEIHVEKNLQATVDGSGDIKYTGNPKNVSKNIVGSGDIEKK